MEVTIDLINEVLEELGVKGKYNDKVIGLLYSVSQKIVEKIKSSLDKLTPSDDSGISIKYIFSDNVSGLVRVKLRDESNCKYGVTSYNEGDSEIKLLEPGKIPSTVIKASEVDSIKVLEDIDNGS